MAREEAVAIDESLGKGHWGLVRTGVRGTTEGVKDKTFKTCLHIDKRAIK